MLNIPQLPLEDIVTKGVNWLTNHLSGLFNLMQHVGQTVMDGMTNDCRHYVNRYLNHT